MRGDGMVPGRSKTTTTFEYVGKTAMAVTCSESGRSYHFASPSARVEVDSRDVDSLASHRSHWLTNKRKDEFPCADEVIQ